MPSLQIKRGSSTNRTNFTPVEGEIIYTTDTKLVYVGDGVTPGGNAVGFNVGGTVSSVAVSGGTTGLTTSGGPITSSGTITISGTLAVANGGTGATTAQAALNALAGATTANRVLRGNGTNIVLAQVDLTTDVTGTLPVANGGTGATTSTGTGAVVLATSPTLITPNLGTPSAAVLTNATGLPISSGVSGLGTGVATALAVNTGSSGSFVLLNGALGTPSSGTLTNATGLPLSTGVTGTLPIANGGTGQTSFTSGYLRSNGTSLSSTATISGSDVSGNISGNAAGLSSTLPIASGGTGQTTQQAALNALAGATTAARVLRGNGTNIVLAQVDLTTDVTGTLPVANGGTGATTSTGTGANVLATSPTLITPNLGTPSAAVLTNATGLPISSGVSGLGTGVATALAVNTGSSGSFVLLNGALGTPSSGTLTNATGLPLSTGVTGTLPIASGGTGQTTQQAALNALAGATTANRVLRGNGTNIVLAQVDLTTDVTGTLPVANGGTGATTSTGTGANVLATSPTLVTPILGTPTSVVLTNATGLPLSTGVTGTLAIANGGTGATTAQAALNALAGATTAARVLRGNGTNIVLAQVDLTTDVTGTLPVANGGTGATTSTGTGAVVLATSPGLTTPALSGETFSTTANVTAGTNAQGQGSLTSDYNVITTASNNPSGVTLPSATTGRRIVIVNRGANAVNVYPATGGTIDALSANASIQIPAAGVMIFNASSTTQWYSSANMTLSSGGMVYPGAGIPNSTGSAWGTSYTTTGSGTVVALATSPTLVTPNIGAASATSVSATGNLTGSNLTASSTAANTSYLVGTSYSLTGSNAQSMIDVSGTWNTTGVPSAIKVNITNTASGSGSRLIDLEVGGADRFGIDVNGSLITVDTVADGPGYRGVPLNSQSAAYTLVASDAGKSIVHPITDNNARTFTIPANSSVAFPTGTAITFINMINTCTIAITTDTLYQAGTGSTGTRTLAAYGMATAIKLTTNTWIISGSGLT